MLDLKYKLEECKLVKGIVDTFALKWHKGFFNFTRFTFGRLQFEIDDRAEFVRVSVMDEEGRYADTRGFFRDELDF